jgi:Holliday junction resolvase
MYKKGYRKELEALEILKKNYAFVTRTPKSSTPIDIIALSKNGIKLIQVKSGSSKISKKELEELKKLKEKLGSGYSVEVWYFEKYKKPRIIEIS